MCVCVRFQVNYSIIAVDILLFVVRRSCRPADPAPGSLSDFLARKFLRYHARLLALPVVVTRSNFRPRYTRRITRLPFAKLFARLLFPLSSPLSLSRDLSARSINFFHPRTFCRSQPLSREGEDPRNDDRKGSSSLSLSLLETIERNGGKESVHREREGCGRESICKKIMGERGGETEREWRRRPRRGERRAEMETRRCRWAQKHEIFNPIGSYISAPPSHPIN